MALRGAGIRNSLATVTLWIVIPIFTFCSSTIDPVTFFEEDVFVRQEVVSQVAKPHLQECSYSVHLPPMGLGAPPHTPPPPAQSAV